MDQDVKTKWVEALRSGKYEQTKRMLRGARGFCCLGVLCDISGLGEWGTSRTGRYLPYIIDGRLSDVVMPSPVRDWAGLDRADPNIDVLIGMNDDGFPFTDIANHIEAQL